MTQCIITKQIKEERTINYSKKKGFTLIELIVVIAILTILILMAVPGFLQYTGKAMTARIQNDIRAVEGKILEEYINSNCQFNGTVESETIDDLIGYKNNKTLKLYV